MKNETNLIEIKTNELAQIGITTVSDIISTVKNLPILKEEDTMFLSKNAEHLGLVLENTFMWRTDLQKRSIINDLSFPTIHAKFHQSILEQKVQFDQSMHLAKDFEMLKLDIEDLECELEELDAKFEKGEISSKRRNIQNRRILLDINFKKYALQQMRIAMKYRMDEVKGWQMIEEDLLTAMRQSGLTEEEIWTKDMNETKDLFFLTMNNLRGIAKTTDSGEYNNLVSLAVFSYKKAAEAGMLESFKKEATFEQLDSIKFVEQYIKR